jgi:glycine cleavage system transcriptional repressor
MRRLVKMALSGHAQVKIASVCEAGDVMKKIVLFVLGPDGPGIIATISKALFEHGCNLEDVSQTILQGEFISIFIVSMKGSGNENELLAVLRAKLDPLGLFAHMKTIGAGALSQRQSGEGFVVTTIGPDRPGLIAGITEVFARHNVNIMNLKAVTRVERIPPEYITIYEVDIPPSTDFNSFRAALLAKARVLDLDVNLQHREIFERINRV